MATILLLGACTDDALRATEPIATAPVADIALPDDRPFLMGFTRWPYAFHEDAVDWTWDAIDRHADLVTIHHDAGVPWQEALDGAPYPERVRAEIEADRRRAERFDTVMVTATPQHNDRATIARYWGDDGSQTPLPAEWEGRALDDPEVISAYLAFTTHLIETYEPDYFAYGIEVNAGYRPNTEPHRQILGLAEAVYPALKAAYPDLPIFLTFQIGSWEAGDDEVMEITESLLPFTDIVALSAYPFLDFADPLRAEAVPDPVDDWMARFAALGKPIAVAETGYAAEPLVIDSLGIDMASTPDWQATYVEDLLASAAQHAAEFVVYWEIRDYDEGYQFLLDLGADPALAVIWRDIGLYDGAGVPRPALGVWDAWFRLPIEGP